ATTCSQRADSGHKMSCIPLGVATWRAGAGPGALAATVAVASGATRLSTGASEPAVICSPPWSDLLTGELTVGVEDAVEMLEGGDEGVQVGGVGQLHVEGHPADPVGRGGGAGGHDVQV